MAQSWCTLSAYSGALLWYSSHEALSWHGTDGYSNGTVLQAHPWPLQSTAAPQIPNIAIMARL
eukprot:scaffold34556_cov28-Tisochrysis_lutea.AAC.1